MSDCFRFVKVEDFFNGYQGWNTVGDVTSHVFDSKQQLLALGVTAPGTLLGTAALLLQFPRKDTYRFQFDPAKLSSADYPSSNTRCKIAAFQNGGGAASGYTVQYTEASDHLEIVTKEGPQPYMKVIVSLKPFSLAVYRFTSTGDTYQVMADAPSSLYYKKNVIDANNSLDYSIIRVKQKPLTAWYVGFGEHGGATVHKNSVQQTFFNYDNYLYKKVYDRGPLDEREPLYHSTTLMMEINGIPSMDSAVGIFIDNPSQVFTDISYLDTQEFKFATRFNHLDYYVFLGDSCGDVLRLYASLVGHAQLKPRYVLGYHQGCYGYDTRDTLMQAAYKYRQYQIPIDGLHIDVDLQHHYQTFTIDQSAFPNPQDMFTQLRASGFKCSTNITPIISNRDPNYSTYASGLANGYFVNDRRMLPAGRDGEVYQDYSGGTQLSIYESWLGDSHYDTGKPYIGEVYYGNVGSTQLGTEGHYPDFGRPEVREWWGQQYKYLFDVGLEMVWQDMTTPAVRNTRGDMSSFPFKLLLSNDFDHIYDPNPHGVQTTPPLSPAIKIWNLYSYNLHKATYEGLNRLPGRDNKRNFIIGRGSFSGSTRFAGLWTGDNASSWEFWQICVPQMLAIGLSGQAIAGADVGGFDHTQDGEQWADPELLIRWTAGGAFLPWFRNHYIRKGHKLFQEPWGYAELNLAQYGLQSQAAMYQSVLPVCKYYIELRYRLLQLFYDAMFENVLTGMPICRAMFLTDHQDKALFNDKVDFLNNQFLVRNDLLIAPVLEPQSSENNNGCRDVYLPWGSNWYTFMDDKRPLAPAVRGGTIVYDFDAHISGDPDHIGFIVPMFVRAGAVIPTIELEQYVGERHANGQLNPITLNIYPAQSGSYTMYLDDGVSRSSAPAGDDPAAKGEYRETHVSHGWTGNKTRWITISRGHDGYAPPEPYFFVGVLHDPGETEGLNGPLQNVSVNATAVDLLSGGSPKDRADRLAASSTAAWYHNEQINISFLKIFDDRANITVELAYA